MNFLWFLNHPHLAFSSKNFRFEIILKFSIFFVFVKIIFFFWIFFTLIILIYLLCQIFLIFLRPYFLRFHKSLFISSWDNSSIFFILLLSLLLFLIICFNYWKRVSKRIFLTLMIHNLYSWYTNSSTPFNMPRIIWFFIIK